MVRHGDFSEPLAAQGEGASSIGRLADVPGVRAVHGIEMYVGSVVGFPEDVTLFATPQQIGRSIDRVELERGRQPDPSSADEVMLTSGAAEALGKDVGDSIAFMSLSRAQLAAFISEEGPGDEEWPPGPDIMLRVVGDRPSRS